MSLAKRLVEAGLRRPICSNLEDFAAFDEAGYLTANPDVAATVTSGQFESGRQHYVLFGRNEKRKLRPEGTAQPAVDLSAAKTRKLAVIEPLLADVIFPRAGFRWHAETVAHAFGVAVPVVTSYFGHKHFSFKRR